MAQGDFLNALRIVSERKGWNPAKLDGRDIEVGLPRSINGPERSLSPFPADSADPDGTGVYDQRVLRDRSDVTVPWSHPLRVLNAGSGMQESTDAGYTVPPIRDASVARGIERRRAGIRGKS